MADDEIMIEDDAVVLEDAEDSVAEDADVTNIIPFIMERYRRAEDYRYQDEEVATCVSKLSWFVWS